MTENNVNEKFPKVRINWYPGHMEKAKRLMINEYKNIDVVYELIDARIPKSSKITNINDIIGNKPRILIMTKKDLTDLSSVNYWVKYYEELGYKVILADLENKNDINRIIEATHQLMEDVQKKRLEKGLNKKEVRVLVVGIPNVGKSTLINKLAGRKVATVGNKPGVTKGLTWLKTNHGIMLLDTPGILWPKFEDQEVGMRLAFIGSINDEILIEDELAMDLIRYLKDRYPLAIEKRFNIEESDDPVVTLEQIARARGCYKKGQEINYTKAASILMDEFRAGKLGKMTLEYPNV